MHAPLPGALAGMHRCREPSRRPCREPWQECTAAGSLTGVDAGSSRQAPETRLARWQHLRPSWSSAVASQLERNSPRHSERQ
eukprot:246715-Chlamydomonas_euryale.AAC.1